VKDTNLLRYIETVVKVSVTAVKRKNSEGDTFTAVSRSCHEGHTFCSNGSRCKGNSYFPKEKQ
jgi:hypothetical protein